MGAASDVPPPSPRGPLSAHLLEMLCGSGPGPSPYVSVDDALTDGDLQLALYLCYELHYTGWPTGRDLEWDPEVLRFRSRLERCFLARVRSVVGTSWTPRRGGDIRDVVCGLLADYEAAPSLSAYMAARGNVDQMREFVVHRSAYQLKEADPHTWAIPRLRGRAKRALVEIQKGEYGTDQPEHEMHSVLFERTMRALDLDDRCNAYVDSLPATTLATSNLVSMFGLHRRLRGALVGHLTAFELTSVVPMGRYSLALERLGYGSAERRFYDVHVLADVEHAHVALEHLAASLAIDEPALASDIVFGVHAALELESRFGSHLLERWAANATSLHTPLAA